MGTGKVFKTGGNDSLVEELGGSRGGSLCPRTVIVPLLPDSLQATERDKNETIPENHQPVGQCVCVCVCVCVCEPSFFLPEHDGHEVPQPLPLSPGSPVRIVL